MLFNSFSYLLLFLPLAWLVYTQLGKWQLSNAQLLWLVLASLFFYACWNPAYLLLILGSIAVNFAFGRALAASSPSRLTLGAGVAFNLLLLAYFKYTGFFLENLNALAESLIPIPEITLPLAISFFTFQQIAYLVDVYRGEAKDYSFGHYCLFVGFFPQLVAGPIVHHREMMPQFDRHAERGHMLENLQVGLTIISIGLFKKVILADNLALLSDPIFAQAEGTSPLSTVEAWVAVLAFSGQIYFDFSGYTDIAIGSARLFGIKLPENFYSPYRAASVIEFWRRWHITLSRFLRDYLYISLGGNRRGRILRYRNLLLTMLLGGLWHGAHWNFVIWGGLHGLYLVINHGWRHLCRHFGIHQQGGPGIAVRLAYQCLTLLSVLIAWVFFRAESTEGASAMLRAMTAFNGMGLSDTYLLAVSQAQPVWQHIGLLFPQLPASTLPLLLLCLAIAVCLLLPNTQQFMAAYQPVLQSRAWSEYRGAWRWRPSVGFAVGLALLAYLSLLNIDNAAEFIYFQF